jgi:hypothetical protein
VIHPDFIDYCRIHSRIVKEIRLSSMSKEAKLAELRAKTDIELARYLTSKLNLAVRLASESKDHSRIRAEEAYAEIAQLLPVVQKLSTVERRRLAAKLQWLREMLDRVPALAESAH